MRNIIIFIDKLLKLYLYYIIGACILSWVPNINPDYPLFNFIFTSAGFYIILPFLGLSISPAVVMLACALIIMGLQKIYDKFYAKNKPEIIILSKDDFEKLKQENIKEENKDDDV